MSIYFVHVAQSFLPFAFIVALLLPSLRWREIFVIGTSGAVFGAMAFYIFRQNADNFYYIINCALVISLILTILAGLMRIALMKVIILFMLSFLFMSRYCYTSRLFPLFSTDFLETLAITSMGFITLAIILSLASLCLLRYLQARWLGILVVILILNTLMGDILLKLMQDSIIPTHTLLLSYVAKTIYYSFLIPYILLAILMIFGIILLYKLPQKPIKNISFDNVYRMQKAMRLHSLQKSFSSFAIVLLAGCCLLYFDLIASSPVVIDPPIIVEPEHGRFVFDTKMLDDNKLHRYAYVTNEGKVVRFFLLNRFKNRPSPGVVFDACALCGDMGYVKQGDELICIACNVRIFLPSVGKNGGCNPIPLVHKIENDKIIISVYDVIQGSNFFSQTQEKHVIDPVDGQELINFQAPFQYSFKGITYYFANEANQKAFIDNPTQYVDDGINIPYPIQRRAQ